MKIEPHDVHIFPTAADFRSWLERHHDTAMELWVGFYKKGSRKTSMTYPEAVEAALCFGWIDGVARRIDDEVAGQRFTPRRRTSNWSAINIAKVAELTAAGRMHPAGLRAFEERDRRRDGVYSYERPVVKLPDDLLRRFQADTAAWSRWEAETPSYRRGASHWITEAKRPETRERRFQQLLEASRRNSRPRPFLVTREERGSA